MAAEGGDTDRVGDWARGLWRGRSEDWRLQCHPLTRSKIKMSSILVDCKYFFLLQPCRGAEGSSFHSLSLTFA